MSKLWYNQLGPEGDVVLSSRVRLARNLNDYPFTARLTDEGKHRVAETVRRAAQEMAELGWVDMTQMQRSEALSMAERRLISAQFAQQLPGTALLMEEDERVSIMLCEEDHLRLQSLAPGLALEDAYARADEIDTILSRHLNYAFSGTLGYLTQCPTNLGTAMRVSVMLHLPALAALGRVGRLGENISKLGLTIRGAFGEGSDADGALFQLSNQVTLGISEGQAIENLRAITLQVIDQERRAQSELMSRPEWPDKIWRAYGICRCARRMESAEATRLLSLVRMGAARGILQLPLEALNALMIDIQPATLSLARNAADPAARDTARAELIREQLALHNS